jgi:hypothetical protein
MPGHHYGLAMVWVAFGFIIAFYGFSYIEPTLTASGA